MQVSTSGDVCALANGVYDTDRDVTVVDRPNLASITIRGDSSAAGFHTILDGSVAGPTVWVPMTAVDSATGRRSPSCVWESAPLAAGSPLPAQLWITNGQDTASGDVVSTESFEVLTPARFPNARLSDDSVFTAVGPNGSMLYSSKASTFGELVDDGTHTPSLATSGLDVTGMVAVIPLGVMGDELQGVRVTKHSKGVNHFSYTALPGTTASLHPK
jgi:hypothetical protein